MYGRLHPSVHDHYVEIDRLIEALRRPDAYPYPVDEVLVVQTHASVVFLAGDFVFKVKKSLNLGFLDYSTLDRRKRMCEREVALNARLSDDIYLGVVPIVATDDGLKVEGTGLLVEVAVKMRRLPDRARLGSRLQNGEVGMAQVEDLGRRLAVFHQHAFRSPDVADMARFSAVQANCYENFEQLAPFVGTIVSETVFAQLKKLTDEELQRQRARIDARAQGGWPCETHGDLRLEHVYLFPDRPAPKDISIVDCIEFNERFRYADPVADIAFLSMDLRAHGYEEAARYLLNGYFEAAGDDDGRNLIRLYTAYRATVRGKVRAFQSAEPEIPDATRAAMAQVARGHLLQAFGELSEPQDRPCMLITCGLPGSGKSVLARGLAEKYGFTVIRSDEVRKRLAGTQRTKTSPDGGVYASEWTDRVYEVCLEEATQKLWEGQRVIVDAAFRQEAQRALFLETARHWNVATRILHCTASDGVIRDRLENRRNDPSDADWAIYQHMKSQWEPFSDRSRPFVLDVCTESLPSQLVASMGEELRSMGLVAPRGVEFVSASNHAIG